MSSRASIAESFKLAADSLRGSKLRSFLTLLGIILSTTTLIAVMSLIHGMDVYVANKIADMGAGGFVVVRFAFLGDWDPKKFLEFLKKNPELNAYIVRDALYMVIDAMQRAKSVEPAAIQKALTTCDIQGITGHIKIGAQHDPVGKEAWIIKVVGPNMKFDSKFAVK